MFFWIRHRILYLVVELELFTPRKNVKIICPIIDKERNTHPYNFFLIISRQANLVSFKHIINNKDKNIKYNSNVIIVFTQVLHC